MSVGSKYSHHPHIMPLKLYLGVGGALTFLTLVTVAVSQVHLGPFNLVVALTIATIKAILVGLFFMHLLHDNKLFAVIFLSAFAFLGIFISFTLFDTMRRNVIYEEVGHTIKPDAVIYKGPGQPIKAAPEEEGKP
jgi:cytochrome c oxidase subunit IV